MAHCLAAYARKCAFSLLLILSACFLCFHIESARAGDEETFKAVPGGSSRPDIATGAVDCRELAALLEQQKSLISRETGQLKREIAALREDLSKPGIKEIFAGIGYILGLMGIGLYAQNRRTTRK